MITETTPLKAIFSRLPLWLALLSCLMPTKVLSNQPAMETLTDRQTAGALSGQSWEADSTRYDRVLPAEGKAAPSLASAMSNPPEVVAEEASGMTDQVPCLVDWDGASDGDLSSVTSENGCTTAASAQKSGFRFGRRMRTQNHMLGDFDGFMLVRG